MDIAGIDFVALATGYGCAASSVATTDALVQALEDALRRDGPTVLEIPITAEVKPLLQS